jgi:hypothetical protein
MGFTLQGLLLETMGTALAAPALVSFPAQVRHVPMGAGGRGRLQGFVPGSSSCCAGPPKGPGASMPSWASPVQSVPSPRPGVPLWFAGPPLARVRRRDVHVRRRQRVFGHGGIGWSLSGLPALLGFLTLRPSRRRGVRRGGRAHGFASRLGRVASGPNRSLPPRERTDRGVGLGPAPPSFGERLAASSDRQSLFFKERMPHRNGRSRGAENPTGFAVPLRVLCATRG